MYILRYDETDGWNEGEERKRGEKGG
jgi:hypothetical protein